MKRTPILTLTLALASAGLAVAAGGCNDVKKTGPAAVSPAASPVAEGEPAKTPEPAEPVPTVAPPDENAEPTTAAQPAPAAAAAPNPGDQAAAGATAAIGKPAPDFTLTDTEGHSFHLGDERGKLVVLEWFNPGCPFVKYAYSDDGPLSAMAKKDLGADVVWVRINSGAPGKQGNGVDVNREAQQAWGLKAPVLLDEAGTVGRAYDAKTTPHLYIVGKDGTLLYMGGIDNAPLGDARGEEKVNYVEMALADIAAGKPVAVPETKAYGCSVKY
ncbi:MAG: redoxin domain-containing protein [Deltaproteobacteria bacterium]|nr:redoxin domain-containing protein [Deltaproteobacteria bacterium]